jgi:hypothetical protein
MLSLDISMLDLILYIRQSFPIRRAAFRDGSSISQHPLFPVYEG